MFISAEINLQSICVLQMEILSFSQNLIPNFIRSYWNLLNCLDNVFLYLFICLIVKVANFSC
jgi:hypothetical protein